MAAATATTQTELFASSFTLRGEGRGGSRKFSMWVQEWGTYIGSLGLTYGAIGNYGVEVEAYSAAIVEMDHWIDCALERAGAFRKAKNYEEASAWYCRANTIVREKDLYLEEFGKRRYGGLTITDPAGELMTVERYRKELVDLGTEISKVKDAIPPPPEPQPQKPPTTEGSEKLKHEEKRFQRPEGHQKLDGLKFGWRGQGRAAGHVLDVIVENTTDEDLECPFVPGIVLTAQGAQTLILADVKVARVGPGRA